MQRFEQDPSWDGRSGGDEIFSVSCAHTFGLGVLIVTHGTYADVNPHRFTEGRNAAPDAARLIGEMRAG